MNVKKREKIPAAVLYLPQALLQDTHAHFLPYWRAGVETACYWFGMEVEQVQIATTLALPRLFQTSGSYQVDSASMRLIAQEMRDQGLVNLAQIHTHPPGCSVWHSRYDDQHAYSTREGALSLIWSGYGLGVSHTLAGIGVHERRNGRWVHLSEEEIAKRMRLVDSLVDHRWELLPGKSAEVSYASEHFEPPSR